MGRLGAKIVGTVPWIDAKYYAATQTMNEARHTEVFQRYLTEKLTEPYATGPYLKRQVFGLLEDSRWDFAYLGMQIVIESLALAAFGAMLRREAGLLEFEFGDDTPEDYERYDAVAQDRAEARTR